MRLSVGSLVFVLLFASLTSAQHQNSSSSSTAPAPAPAPSAAPAMHSSPVPSAPSMPSTPSHTFTPRAPSHTPTPSTPSRVDSPSMHSAPAPSHSTAESAPTIRGKEVFITVGTKDTIVTPPAKAGEPPKATFDLRVNKNPEPKPGPVVPVQSDLRKRICEGGLPCKDSAPQPPQNDSLRHCLVGIECKCPAGQSYSNGGCVANTVSKTAGTCAPGTSWNGSSCVQSYDCPAGQSWNGVQCASIVCSAGQIRRGASCVADCTGVTGFTAGKIAEVRSARRDKDDACRQGASTVACQQADTHYFTVLNEYRGLLSSVPIECQASLPVPETL